MPPGKLCDGDRQANPIIPNSQAYCRGFYDRAQSAITTNPHDQDAEPVAYADYEQGVTNAAALAGQTLTGDQVGCCAGAGLTVPI